MVDKWYYLQPTINEVHMGINESRKNNISTKIQLHCVSTLQLLHSAYIASNIQRKAKRYKNMVHWCLYSNEATNIFFKKKYCSYSLKSEPKHTPKWEGKKKQQRIEHDLNRVVSAHAEHAAGAYGHGFGERHCGVGGVDGGIGQYHVSDGFPQIPWGAQMQKQISSVHRDRCVRVRVETSSRDE